MSYKSYTGQQSGHNYNISGLDSSKYASKYTGTYEGGTKYSSNYSATPNPTGTGSKYNSSSIGKAGTESTISSINSSTGKQRDLLDAGTYGNSQDIYNSLSSGRGNSSNGGSGSRAPAGSSERWTPHSNPDPNYKKSDHLKNAEQTVANWDGGYYENSNDDPFSRSNAKSKAQARQKKTNNNKSNNKKGGMSKLEQSIAARNEKNRKAAEATKNNYMWDFGW